VLVLCGDLTDVGKPRVAEVLAEDLRACSIPVIGVLGNHDYESGQVEDVEKIMKAAGVHLLNGQSYEANGVAFVGVKGFVGGFGRRMLASFGEAVVKSFVAESMAEAIRLENAMRTVRNERAVVVERPPLCPDQSLRRPRLSPPPSRGRGGGGILRRTNTVRSIRSWRQPTRRFRAK
jgi:Icc-related predicted phosphoesterase